MPNRVFSRHRVIEAPSGIETGNGRWRLSFEQRMDGMQDCSRTDLDEQRSEAPILGWFREQCLAHFDAIGTIHSIAFVPAPSSPSANFL